MVEAARGLCSFAEKKEKKSERECESEREWIMEVAEVPLRRTPGKWISAVVDSKDQEEKSDEKREKDRERENEGEKGRRKERLAGKFIGERLSRRPFVSLLAPLFYFFLVFMYTYMYIVMYYGTYQALGPSDYVEFVRVAAATYPYNEKKRTDVKYS